MRMVVGRGASCGVGHRRPGRLKGLLLCTCYVQPSGRKPGAWVRHGSLLWRSSSCAWCARLLRRLGLARLCRAG